MQETIRVEKRFDDRVTEITLGPPPANIVTAAVIGEMSSAIELHARDKKTRVIVITGEGKHFSFGASVEEHTPELIADMLPRFHRLVAQILECDVPTLARVSGLCLGGAFEIVLACSLIFADTGAQFAVPEIQLGVFPPVASVLLPRMIGSKEANRIILTGQRIGAARLHELGLVNEVVESGALAETTDAFIEEHLLSKSSSSLRLTCRAVRRDIAAHYRESIADIERLYLEDLMSTADAVEGIQSFLEKRKPQWKDA